MHRKTETDVATNGKLSVVVNMRFYFVAEFDFISNIMPAFIPTLPHFMHSDI